MAELLQLLDSLPILILMSSAVLRVVFLVSFGHGLVHIYEHSFASVEQLVAEEFGVGKETTGLIGSCLRLPFGLFALAAGWMADRWGARRLLLVYVIGCSLSSLLVWGLPGIAGLFLAIFLLGVFAGIYHPAGVGWIVQQTHPDKRPLALGYHGIFGSGGIAAGPFLAALVLQWGVSWRTYYLFLGLVGGLLGWLLAISLPRQNHQKHSARRRASPLEGHSVKKPRILPGPDLPIDLASDRGGNTSGGETAVLPSPTSGTQPTDSPDPPSNSWLSFWILTAMTSLAGMVYAAVTTFLPRYLSQTGLNWAGVSPASMRNYQTGFVLVLGVLGQYVAGRIGRPRRLEILLALIFGLAAPCVVWMGFAKGLVRLAAAGAFAALFFAHQPLYSSAVAKYIASQRRGLAYGIIFTLGFGIGSLGPAIAGQIPEDEILYPILGAFLAAAAVLAALLWRRHRTSPAKPAQPRPPTDSDLFL